MKSIVLPAGTMHVPFGDLPELITGALHPDAGTDSSAIKYVAARNEVLRALRRAVAAGNLPVFSPLNPMVPHEFPVGDALNRARVTLGDLREFLASRLDVVTTEPTTAPAQSPAKPPPVVAASDGPALKNKSETTLIFEAKVIELMRKFWNERTPGTEPTKGDLSKLVYLEILRTGTRGKRKTTQGMVNDAAKPWKFPLVLPTFVRESQFNEKRHPFKGDR